MRFVVLVLLGWLPLSGVLARSGQALEVGPGIEPPKLLSSPSVAYPDYAKPAKGDVVIRAVIDRDGHVRDAEVVSSPDKRLSKAAVAAMKARAYAPATREGQPVDVWWTATFRFVPPEDEIAAVLACDLAKIPPGNANDCGDTILPVLIRQSVPNTTDAMRRTGGGRVVLECVINACGRVDSCKVLESPGPEFTISAIESARERLYRPASCGGRPLAITFTIRMDFRF